MSKEAKYIYAIRNKETGELMNARCHSGGSYYDTEMWALKRCNQWNSYERKWNSYERDKYEVVEFELNEVRIVED